MSIGVCSRLVDTTHQCMANEVSKTPTAKNSMNVMVAIKQFVGDSPLQGEKNHLHGHIIGGGDA